MTWTKLAGQDVQPDEFLQVCRKVLGSDPPSASDRGCTFRQFARIDLQVPPMATIASCIRLLIASEPESEAVIDAVLFNRWKFLSVLSWFSLHKAAGVTETTLNIDQKGYKKPSAFASTDAYGALLAQGIVPNSDVERQYKRAYRAAAMAHNPCAFCGAYDARMRCETCMIAFGRRVAYCGLDCQKKHWKMHKLVCGREAALSHQ